MATITTNNAHYAAIAAAIRAKNGETGQYKPSAMAAKIAAIPTGAELNYTVVAAQSCPETAEENTIWLQSSRAVTTAYFQREAPASPTAGTVWIKQGVGGHVPICPVKDVNFMLYPVSAKQYTGSEWEDVSDAATYINGAWENWHTHIYDRGNEYADICGGWRCLARAMNANKLTVTPTLTRESASLYVTGTSRANSYSRTSEFALATIKLIDLSDVNSIRIETSDSLGNVTLCLRQNGESYVDTSPAVTCTNATSTKRTYTLDVSSVTGLREVNIVVTSTGSSSSANAMAARVHRVWFE